MFLFYVLSFSKIGDTIVLPQHSLLQKNVSARPGFCLRTRRPKKARHHACARDSLKPGLAPRLPNKALFYYKHYGGHYSRGDIIQEMKLFKEIRYVLSNHKKYHICQLLLHHAVAVHINNQNSFFFLHIYNEVNCHRKIYFDCCNAHNAMKSKINDAEIDLKTNSQK